MIGLEKKQNRSKPVLKKFEADHNRDRNAEDFPGKFTITPSWDSVCFRKIASKKISGSYAIGLKNF